MQVRYSYSRWVVYYTHKTIFILYLQAHIARNFLSRKTFIFSPPVQHNSHPIRSVDQSKFYTGYIWIMCATVGVCFCVWPMSELHKAWRYYWFTLLLIQNPLVIFQNVGSVQHYCTFQHCYICSRWFETSLKESYLNPLLLYLRWSLSLTAELY